tara:strand:- start:108 stop:287 length:180 start_codon:yes stop_codon:yes gene_type:complete
MGRRKRTYTHKGKLRYKRRLPRKLKKQRKKDHAVYFARMKERLENIYGDEWVFHMTLGG